MRREPTDAERRLWTLLRAKRLNGAKFKRQEQIGNFIVDFVCYDARVIVEADGSHHADRAGDCLRDEWLSSQGFRVLRFWNNQILSETNAVADAILNAVTAHD